MRLTTRLGLAGLLVVTLAHADGMPPVPKDYPSHARVGSCYQAALGSQLQEYNETRLQLAQILRHMSDEPAVSPAARQRLLGFADNLDAMRGHLPPPDPDSNAFRNFDFQLGITLTATTLFLNSEDEQLTKRFVHDRDDPQSELGQYLVRLEQSRQQYTNVLAASQVDDCNS